MDGACLELIHRVPGANPQLDALEERALIRQAQRGDRGAFEQLVRKYEGSVLRLALQVVRSEEEAKDLYQESFLKIYRALGRFRFESRFSTWVYRVVMNVCLDHLRRAGTRREVQAPAPAAGSDPEPVEFFQTVAEERPELDPERALQGKEVGRRIRAALARLSPRERLVFELKHYQGMKLRAIGEYCGTSEQTVKNCLFRATQKLRAELKEIV
ncbi:MAG: sigma-70 family RNA polymerase sigma factor [Acidobacteria bacterium]|nr:sigma-70 family RNA polymerase sigma factor [Acidobacteriota bacterium]